MTTDIETIGMLRNSLERYMEDNYSFLQRLERMREPGSFSQQIWAELAEFGFLSLCLPTENDGLDGDAAVVGALMEVAGKALLQEPFLMSAVLATRLVARLGNGEQRERLLAGLASGEVVLSCAVEHAHQCQLEDNRLSGRIPLVMHGDAANGLLVAAQDAQGQLHLCLVNTDQSRVQRTAARLLDGRGAASISFDNAQVELLATPNNGLSVADNLQLLLDEANVALCAEACGMIDALLHTTNEYLKMRKQFGRPLAVNQALQHRMADLYLLQQETHALTQAAQQALTGPAAERARLVSGARSYISDAARKVANEAVQLHGGLGITEELDVSHYFRRVMLLNSLLGGRDKHFLRFVEQSLTAA
ncbi:acyl-CoA dehydrogenase family protein [Pseudomonas sp. MYb185]|uniref:acyl-CoA dehydrogenase family protein n=1 Tax=Pseudomonas sp. MYb185 TaxID=1848729 RepID=UPI000CFCAE10|nr:acyl-CoA dehydrogenase family protein [Pseudomonas sp. MYb185]PRB84102.1 acyl-CoA dehydrogenase [Pseudomonas sp. MYb185]